jgi:hypothetical protein
MEENRSGRLSVSESFLAKELGAGGVSPHPPLPTTTLFPEIYRNDNDHGWVGRIFAREKRKKSKFVGGEFDPIWTTPKNFGTYNNLR